MCLFTLLIATVFNMFSVHEIGRFSEVANLIAVCWLEIRGKIGTKILSPNTTYGAYFIYTLSDHAKELQDPVKVYLRVENEMEGHTTNAYLQMPSGRSRVHRRSQDDGRLPRTREDMWLEIEIGEFYRGQVDGMVEMWLRGLGNPNWKSGLVVYGIELRPKAQI